MMIYDLLNVVQYNFGYGFNTVYALRVKQLISKLIFITA